ncbi:MAG: helix-turn-helix transcriptional regulator [Lachnospiraceae bacterium]|nr:helix-turn-helix transcriptional regulator [Lachnospiraceae bacterium]
MIEDDILNRINYFLDFKHWSVYKLAKESGLPYSSLNNIFIRKTCPTLPTLKKICDGLNISLTEFFSFQKNPIKSQALSDTEEDIINSYRSLSSKDKELLETYLRGLCKR